MAASDIQGLSEEVVENILVSLRLPDICNLRLCSTSLAAKATQPHFKSFFRSKTIQVDTTALDAFIKMTENFGLGCLVEHLTIVGIVDDSRRWSYKRGSRAAQGEATARSKEAITLLSKAMQNITVCGDRRLRAITLKVADIRTAKPGTGTRDNHHDTLGRWRPVWHCGVLTFYIAMSSIGASQLLVDELHVFDDFNVQRCSLASSKLETILCSTRHKKPLNALKRLSLSFSDAEDGTKLGGLRKLLELSPNLEQLELHQFSLGVNNLPDTQYHPALFRGSGRDTWTVPSEAESNIVRLFQRASEAATLPRLKRLHLRGIHTTGEDLLRFVQRTAPRNIILLHVSLVSGKFRPFFDYCSTTSSIDAIDFQDLREDTWPIVFASTGWYGTLRRSGSQVVQTLISYHVPGLPMQGGPALYEKRRVERHLYGPL